MINENNIKPGAIFEKRQNGILIQELAIISIEIDGYKKLYLSDFKNPCLAKNGPYNIEQICTLLEHMEYKYSQRKINYG